MSEKLKIVYRPLQELSPYAHNARTHSPEQVAQLVESIKQFGWTNPVLIDEKGEIIAGHGRVMAAEMLKMDSVPVIVLSGLTDEQKKAYRLADNRLPMNAGWDEDLLRMELSDLINADFDVSLTGFIPTEIDELLTDVLPGIGWKSKVEKGKVVLTDLRIKEVIIIDGDDFGQKKVEQIRHIMPRRVEIYRRSEGTNGESVWTLHESWNTSRDDIPLVTLYTKKTGFMRGTPPLLNLGLLNIKHWQSQSEQDNILHVTRVPLLVAYGLDRNEELTVGASTATIFEDRTKNGLEYVEHSGAAIESGETSLEKLENQMRHAGAKLLRAENTSTKSVDQTNEERMQENSPLYTMANSLEDALDNILQIMAEWIGESCGGNVDVRTELDVSAQVFDSSSALAVQSLRQGGDIRQIDAVRVLQALKFIDQDSRPEEVIDELKNQSVMLMEINDANRE